MQPYSSKSRGLIEGKNKILRNNILKISSSFDLPWVDAVPLAQIAYNGYTSRATKHSPFYLMFTRQYPFGLPAMLPDTVTADPKQFREDAERMWELSKKLVRDFDLTNRAQRAAQSEGRYLPHIEQGDFVLARRHYVPKGVPKKSLPTSNSVPLRVVDVQGRLLFAEEYNGTIQKMHVDQVIKLKTHEAEIWQTMDPMTKAKFGGFSKKQLEKSWENKEKPIGWIYEEDYAEEPAAETR